ncbi:class I SAM-dependent methyltransferase [Clostridium fermenticellae]|uniref:Class I SAM-dependent methyltransferase n=1 Tax=Clostridium fermenticellae TaxID=2068654 RepID=A0A386H1F1_9CLOT|nr:class I SAM-dependent methyltransferase [Clostridium fermenticellae]AYD39531.1 class I SAM-dependent methyltransferase [Clostridium fermenticellae]
MDIKYFLDLWNSSKKSYDIEEKFWDKRVEEFNNKELEEEESKKISCILEFLEIGKNRRFENVLDIGCGTGFYSKKFSEISKCVTATDISENMLECAKRNLESECRNNVKFVKSIWSELKMEDFEWKGKFDLVFASMTPAIDSYEDLIKMIDCGKNLYFLSGFVEKKDSLKNELSEVILGYHNDNPHGNKIYSAFNILWNMGYYPKISYVDSNRSKLRSVDELYKKYLSYFERKKPLAEEDKVSIRKYIESKAISGIVEDKVTSKTAWLCWRK